jgi:hypothetical protein
VAPLETELLVQADRLVADSSDAVLVIDDTKYRTAGPSRRGLWQRSIVSLRRACGFGCVLADAGYGLSAPFRQGLTARKPAWAVGIPRHRGRAIFRRVIAPARANAAYA